MLLGFHSNSTKGLPLISYDAVVPGATALDGPAIQATSMQLNVLNQIDSGILARQPDMTQLPHPNGQGNYVNSSSGAPQPGKWAYTNLDVYNTRGKNPTNLELMQRLLPTPVVGGPSLIFGYELDFTSMSISPNQLPNLWNGMWSATAGHTVLHFNTSTQDGTITNLTSGLQLDAEGKPTVWNSPTDKIVGRVFLTYWVTPLNLTVDPPVYRITPYINGVSQGPIDLAIWAPNSVMKTKWPVPGFGYAQPAQKQATVLMKSWYLATDDGTGESWLPTWVVHYNDVSAIELEDGTDWAITEAVYRTMPPALVGYRPNSLSSTFRTISAEQTTPTLGRAPEHAFLESPAALTPADAKKVTIKVNSYRLAHQSGVAGFNVTALVACSNITDSMQLVVDSGHLVSNRPRSEPNPIAWSAGTLKYDSPRSSQYYGHYTPLVCADRVMPPGGSVSRKIDPTDIEKITLTVQGR